MRYAARLFSTLGFVAVMTAANAVRADNFANVRYDLISDSLIIKMRYRGTNPDHEFTLRWGPCSDASDGSGKRIVAEVLDSQWRDGAEHDYTKTTPFSLDAVQCRPAKLTLRTAPRFFYTIRLPARPSDSR